MTPEPVPSGTDSDQAGNLETMQRGLSVLRIIHLALVAGVVLFGAVLLIVIRGQFVRTPAYSNPIIILAALLFVGNVGFATLLPQVFRKLGQAPSDVRAVMQKYQVFCLIRWAMIEGADLFAGVAMLLTRNVLALVIYAVCLAFLAMRRPTEREVTSLFANRAW